MSARGDLPVSDPRGPRPGSATDPALPPRRLLFASGGSGGHLFPAIAIAEAALNRWPGCDIRFVTTDRDIERTICEAAGLTRLVLPLMPLASIRRSPLAFWRDWRASVRGVRELLRTSPPDAIVGTGGWSMAPVLSAARGMAPLILCEQNAIPGRAIRWHARRADAVCLTDPASAQRLRAGRIVVTGNPVRAAFAAARRPHRDAGRTLLVLGGSQGARALNQALARLAETCPAWLADCRVMHQTGSQADAERCAAAYARANVDAEVAPFFHDLDQRGLAADVAICRAGATTLAELACLGLPAILIPYPLAAADHQRWNAHRYANAGAARIIEERGRPAEALSGDLGEALRDMLTDAARRGTMSAAMTSLARPTAADAVLDVVEETLARRTP
ncbi:MAG: UDP-N-acetylglucosamine--N-acetylmuramyl-(pentapeptide) pyrophosphoryl-undecaprenol N-acetylglucosamine transferase [Planctomyces sp.]|nr:UDP-N-acetylglucosamine--N-acetylmuramyl-(pentapeptide) pyrophosphoryl-undecaprenol N-acetylglucosamine transferase [Planctomyces sp.]